MASVLVKTVLSNCVFLPRGISWASCTKPLLPDLNVAFSSAWTHEKVYFSSHFIGESASLWNCLIPWQCPAYMSDHYSQSNIFLDVCFVNNTADKSHIYITCIIAWISDILLDLFLWVSYLAVERRNINRIVLIVGRYLLHNSNN